MSRIRRIHDGFGEFSFGLFCFSPILVLEGQQAGDEYCGAFSFARLSAPPNCVATIRMHTSKTGSDRSEGIAGRPLGLRPRAIENAKSHSVYQCWMPTWDAGPEWRNSVPWRSPTTRRLPFRRWLTLLGEWRRVNESASGGGLSCRELSPSPARYHCRSRRDATSDPASPTDCLPRDWKSAGLRAPSCFRLFLLTLPQRSVRRIGRLSDADWESVQGCFRKGLGLELA